MDCMNESSRLSISESMYNSPNDVPDEHSSSSSSSSSSDEPVPITADVESIDPLNRSKRRRTVRTAMVKYGPICIRKRQTLAPTLATGRRSKDVIIPGENVVEREIRRMKNRESARNLSKLRDNIEHELNTQVNQLEFEEKILLTRVHSLQLYKQKLQQQYRQTSPIYQIITQTAADILFKFKQQQMLENNVDELEEKPDLSSSSQWQLSFHI